MERQIEISKFERRDLKERNGNIALASFDCTLCGLIEISGLLLVRYANGNISAFGPRMLNSQPGGFGLRFKDFELRKDVATAAFRVYEAIGGQFADLPHDLEPNKRAQVEPVNVPDENIKAPAGDLHEARQARSPGAAVVNVPSERPRGFVRWATPDRKRLSEESN